MSAALPNDWFDHLGKYGFGKIEVQETKLYKVKGSVEAEKIRTAALKHATRHGKKFKTKHLRGHLHVLRIS